MHEYFSNFMCALYGLDGKGQWQMERSKEKTTTKCAPYRKSGEWGREHMLWTRTNVYLPIYRCIYEKCTIRNCG